MPVMQSPPGPETVIDGRRYLYFAGTGYLGLHGREEVIRAACEAAREYGIGSATSRGGFGDTPPVLEVERRAAGLLGTEAAFYFATGYVGASILVLALDGRFGAVLIDACAHYCLMEAARLSGLPVVPFAHRDPQSLAEKLRAGLAPRVRPLVMTDGVFSALGDVAPLADYAAVLGEYPGSALLVDDAHGLAVLGERGRGTHEHAGLSVPGINAGPPDDVAGPPAVYHTAALSKAIGGAGGVVAGSAAFVDAAKARSHYYTGASAIAVPAAAATARALQIVAREPDLRGRLHRNVALLKGGLRAMGLACDDSPVPIVCLQLGTAARMQAIRAALMQRGVAIAHLHYSGLGPEGALRIAVFADHAETMIARLLDELRRLV